MTPSRKVTGALKYYQAKLCFQGKCLHGLSLLIFTPKFAFEMLMTCRKLIVFDEQNKNVVSYLPRISYFCWKVTRPPLLTLIWKQSKPAKYIYYSQLPLANPQYKMHHTNVTLKEWSWFSTLCWDRRQFDLTVAGHNNNDISRKRVEELITSSFSLNWLVMISKLDDWLPTK